MKRLVKYGLLLFTTLGILGCGALFAIYVWASHDLPSITKLQDYQLPLVTTVYAKDGSVMGILYEEKRYLVNLEQIPKHTINAFLAAEDADFYKHPGIDIKAIFRALITNAISGKTQSGGSTITQQVIKRFLLSPEKSYKRKASEAILAYQLEKKLSKDEILYLYMNEIFFGNNAYGIESASRTYFGKSVGELSIAESAVLAGIPKAPSANNPFENPKNAKGRQGYVLGQMYEKGFIGQADYQTAVAENLAYKRGLAEGSDSVGAWYFEEVRRQLLEFFKEENVKQMGLPLTMYGKDALYKLGLNVYTAMDPVHQKSAEISLRAGLHDACKRRGWRGPIFSITAAEYDEFLKKHPFVPENLEDARWVRALVVAVTKDKAEVRLGLNYKGVISAKHLGWARVPNPNVSPEGAGQVRDATRVLAVGDVVWVSAIGASGYTNPVSVPARPNDTKNPLPAYSGKTITKETPIPVCLEQLPDLQGAVASVEVESGDYVALVGGYAFSSQSQFNRATQALRQPGSSFKPVVYSTALDFGYTAGSILLDSPFSIAASAGAKAWTPGNFDGKFLGPIILRTALAKSRNLCTVRVAQSVGMQNIIERAKALGIPGDIPPVLAVSLGSYEATPATMAEAYTAFANKGLHIKPRYILSIKDRWMQDLVVFNPIQNQAITPQNAYIMSSLLKEVVNAGTAARARVLGRPIAGKTGTSNNERDAWFIGFSPYLVTSVFVGYDNNEPMGRMETGGRASLPIFIDYWKAIEAKYPADDFPVPEGITIARVDAHSGLLAGSGSSESYSLPFVSGTEPSVVSGQQVESGSEEVDMSDEVMKQM